MKLSSAIDSLSPLTKWVLRVYGAEEVAIEGREVQVPVNPWSFL
jgi:hypothetical protein